VEKFLGRKNVFSPGKDNVAGGLHTLRDQMNLCQAYGGAFLFFFNFHGEDVQREKNRRGNGYGKTHEGMEKNQQRTANQTGKAQTR